MNASQLEAEQALLADASHRLETLTTLVQQRDAYRDALEKIRAVRLMPMTFEEKFDRIMTIVEGAIWANK